MPRIPAGVAADLRTRGTPALPRLASPPTDWRRTGTSSAARRAGPQYALLVVAKWVETMKWGTCETEPRRFDIV